MVKVAIVGMGFMGMTHFKAYAKIPSAKVIAVSDADPKRVSGQLAGTWGNIGDANRSQVSMADIHGTTDWRQLLGNPDIDLIDICLPTPAHVEIVTAALSAGKHVFCEKPVGRTVEEVQSILQAAQKSKGFFMPAMCMRFWPQWAWLKQAVQSARFGKVLSATFRRLGSTPPGWFNDGNLSGGAVLDLHIHDTDFVNYLFSMPKSVISRGYSATSGRIDHLATHYIYDDIPLVSAEGGWTMAPGFPFTMRYTVNFQNATADFDLGRSDQLLLIQNGKSEPVTCEGTDGYDGELNYYINCIINKSRPTIVTAADALNSTRIIEAEVRSVNSGGTIIVC